MMCRHLGLSLSVEKVVRVSAFQSINAKQQIRSESPMLILGAVLQHPMFYSITFTPLVNNYCAI